MSTNPADNGRRRVVVAPMLLDNSGFSWAKVIPIWIASAVVNLAIVGLAALLFSLLGRVQAGAMEDLDQQVQTTQVEEERKDEFDLTNPDIGNDSEAPLNFNVDRQEDISVPGMVDPTQAAGIPDASLDAARSNVPLPPGSGGGLGGAPTNLENALAAGGWSSSIGGMGGSSLLGQFAGRSGSTREKMLNEQGGNKVSEAAVATGLHWLALHQAQDGHWSLTEFNQFARDKPRPGGKIIGCNCEAGTGHRSDVAATAFGLLPFLGAGITHKAGKHTQKDYSKVVEGAIHWLMSKQSVKDGSYTSDMYSHGVAAIAMCEAYGLTSDPRIKQSAQRALNFIVFAQDGEGGGWRYRPKESPGDTSVAGWQLMALKSGQMAGLSVPRNTLKLADRFLDSVEANVKGTSLAEKGGAFKYLAVQQPTVTMTSVGLLCRMYSGLGPKNPAIRNGVKMLRENHPGKNDNIYYLYYATQVMHHMQGESWRFWNEGRDADGKQVHKGIRDSLMSKQDKGTTPKYPHQAGSWGGSQGGRIMATSLSLLCLEVYYRHLPLYRRDIADMKDIK